MLARLLPFELTLQFKQLGFWITILFVFVVSALFGAVEVSLGGERIKANGALAIARQTSELSIFAIFFGAIYVVSGVMRDQVTKALEVIHATPAPSPAMIIARFFGAFAATLISLLVMVIGVYFAQFLPWVDQEILGPFNFMYYLQPTLVFVTLNALLVTALFTAVATLTKDRTLVYVSAVALYILYNISTFFINDDTPELLVSILDPFGTAALAQVTEFWPASEQNTRLVPLTGYVGFNRLVWGSVALGLFVYSFFGFQRGMARSTKGRGSAIPSNLQDEIILHSLSRPISRGSLPVLLKRTAFEYLATVKSVAFLILSGLVIALSVSIILVRNEVTPDPTLPTNAAIAQFAFVGTLLPLLLITIFFAGEIIWRDRTNRMTELIDSTSVQNWPLVVGKWLAMFGVILTIVTLGMLIGVFMQLFLGDIDLVLSTHLKNAYINFAPRTLLFAALVMFIQNFMPNRVVGMIVGGIVVVAILAGMSRLPFYHPIMNYGNTPNGEFSEINGFEDMRRYFWFLLYWSGLAGLFAVGSIWLWRRGLQTSLHTRLRALRGQLSPLTGIAALVSAFAFIGAGFTLYKGYSIDNDYQPRNALEARLANLENELGDHIDDILPRIRDVDVEVQLYPMEKAADVMGTYRIVNTTGAPMDTLYLTTTAELEDIREITLEGAELSLEDETEQHHTRDGIRLYKFAEPLAEGAETTLSFNINYPTPTLGGTQLIRTNGTFVNNQTVMPMLGVADFRITNPDRRRNNDLPELEDEPERADLDARQMNFFDRAADYVNFKATVCTQADQIPIAPGTVKREYEVAGRICRDFEPNEPIVNFFAFLSADYESEASTWTGENGQSVDLEILYDAQHDYNIDLMMRAMKDALDVFTQTYGPYQYDVMRILEFPYGAFAQSFAGTIPFSENIGFVIDPGDADDNTSVDLATYVTMHEIGHQWFGHQIVPAVAQGYNVLSEGLTENAAMTAYERTYGWQKARRLLEQRTIQQYLTGRTRESGREMPLSRARIDQQYLTYNKASWVFWGLKQYIGEEQMQAAIRDFLNEYGRTGPPYPTTLELLDHLRDTAGPDYQQLITDYWDRITFWELRFAEVKPTVEASGDMFSVTLTLDLDKKIASEDTGREISVTEAAYDDPPEDSDAERGELLRAAEDLNEWVEIGFYTKDPSDTFGDEWLSLERVRVTEKETELTFELEERPTYVVLDPRRLLIERNAADNTFRFPIERND